VKTREPRQKVLIRARLRGPDGWHDACILNISSRGMLLQVAEPPARGSYLEIRRGSHVMMARVVWAGGHRLGVRMQDLLCIDAIVGEPDSANPDAAVRIESCIERRATPRASADAHEQSRWRAHAYQFVWLVMIAASAAMLASARSNRRSRSRWPRYARRSHRASCP